LLQAGTLFKAVGTVFICAIATYTIARRQSPSMYQRRVYLLSSMLLSLGLIFASILSESARLFCDVNIPKYQDASKQRKIAILSYFYAFIGPVYICAAVDVVFFLYMKRHIVLAITPLSAPSPSTAVGPRVSPQTVVPSNLQSISDMSLSTIEDDQVLDASSGLEQSPHPSSRTTAPPNASRDAEVRITVNRLILYPLLFFVGWLPDSISLTIILATGRESTLNRLVSNAFAASVGWAMAVSYFYYQWLLGKHAESRNSSNHTATRRAQRHIETTTAVGSSYMETQRSTAAPGVEHDPDLDSGAAGTSSHSAPGSQASASSRQIYSSRSSFGVLHDSDSRSNGSIGSSADPPAAVRGTDTTASSVHQMQVLETQALSL
jgi:hypothetical protein